MIVSNCLKFYGSMKIPRGRVPRLLLDVCFYFAIDSPSWSDANVSSDRKEVGEPVDVLCTSP